MTGDPDEVREQWTRMVEQVNDAVAESMEENMQAQAAFMESWADAIEESVPAEEELADGIEGYNRAYEVWMDAADELSDRTKDAAQGEDVDPEEFRDIWLQSANEAFKQVMSTSAYAAANGQLVNAMMEMRQQADEINEDTIAQLGFPTREEIDEVGERLVELERRQHEVEEKLDRIIEAVE